MNYRKIAEEALMALPGKRGIDIPEEIFDQIHRHATAATLGVWGRHPLPEHFQQLHDQGLHEAHQIQEAYGSMPHPHADGLTVNEYSTWSKAHEAWNHHSKR